MATYAHPMSGPATRRLDSLTGLRFFAAALVVAYHASDLMPNLRGLTSHGYVGVTFFFVLSGFVLTWSWQPGSARISPRSFWWRRFARIWPLHAITTLGTLAVIAAPASAVCLNLGLVHAWTPGQDSINVPSWSLSAEAFFYAIFPLLVVHAHRVKRVRRALLATIALIPAMIVLAFIVVPPAHLLWSLYALPPFRALEFTCGVLLAVGVKRGWRPHITLVSSAGLTVTALAAVTVGGFSQPFASALLVPPVLLLIAAAATADLTPGRAGLRTAWAVRLGEWSFALYLVHWPVLQAFLRAGLTGWWTIAAFALSIAAAGLLFTLVERPVEAWLRAVPERLRGRRLRISPVEQEVPAAAPVNA